MLILSTGSNLGDRLKNLNNAKEILCNEFELEEESRVYESKAVDYLEQADFLNQVLSFKSPKINPLQVLDKVMSIESQLGRRRDIPKGPRTIDIDILFWDFLSIDTESLELPHPRLFQRSFIVKPLQELEVYNTLSQRYDFPSTFCNEAFPLSDV